MAAVAVAIQHTFDAMATLTTCAPHFSLVRSNVRRPRGQGRFSRDVVELWRTVLGIRCLGSGAFLRDVAVPGRFVHRALKASKRLQGCSSLSELGVANA